MRRRLFSVIAIALIAIFFTGCMRIDGLIDTTKKKTEYVTTIRIWYNKEKVDKFAAGDFSALGIDSASLSADETAQMSMIQPVIAEFQKGKVVKIEGREYYQGDIKKDSEKFFTGELGDDGIIVTKTSFYTYSVSDAIDDDTSEQIDQAGDYLSAMIDKVQIRVKFKDKIKKTNGKLTKNKKTAIFTYTAKSIVSKKKMEAFAYTEYADRTLEEDRALFKKKK